LNHARDEFVRDERGCIDGPSALVIPARVIHTSQGFGEGMAHLIDIFAPQTIT